MAEISGHCSDRFSGVRDVMAANLDKGADVGSSVAIVHEGELVVDLWGGEIDTLEGERRPWAEDTITNVWSTTKTMTALSALVLADRGELDLHLPVATYWPEFAAEGKEAITTAQLLGHTAGLAGWTEPMEPEDLQDWEKCCARLAAQAPWWEPGTASGYHAVTQGYLVGEVVRRISGKSLGTFFHDELAGPLGADFHIGTGPEHDARVARVIPPAEVLSPEGLDPDSVQVRSLTNPTMDARMSWTEGWRRCESPAANGHGNARSVARVQSVLSHRGEVDGHRFLSEDGCNAVFEEQAKGTDLVLQVPLCLGTGYGINSPELPISPNPRACFWGGWGGSIVVNDLDAKLTVAFVMNRMGEGTTGDDRGIGIVLATYMALMS
jgi:CubicO group peptidase (beta-lactamase class C family)